MPRVKRLGSAHAVLLQEGCDRAALDSLVESAKLFRQRKAMMPRFHRHLGPWQKRADLDRDMRTLEQAENVIEQILRHAVFERFLSLENPLFPTKRSRTVARNLPVWIQLFRGMVMGIVLGLPKMIPPRALYYISLWNLCQYVRFSTGSPHWSELLELVIGPSTLEKEPDLKREFRRAKAYIDRGHVPEGFVKECKLLRPRNLLSRTDTLMTKTQQ